MFSLSFLDWLHAVIERVGRVNMRMSLRNGSIHLVEGTPLRLRGARGIHVECTEGMLWLTVQGQGEDFFLARGEQLCIPGDGLVLVEGSPSGTIRLAIEVPSSIRWREAIILPLCDMGWAMRMVVSAFLRLFVGMASYGEYLVAGRGRVMSHFEANPP